MPDKRAAQARARMRDQALGAMAGDIAGLQTVEALLDMLPEPMWLLRADAGIELANVAAITLAQEGVWVQERAGQLQGIGHLDQASLCQHIQALPGSGGASRSAVLIAALSQKGHGPCALLRLMPLTAIAWRSGIWPRAAALLMLQELPSPGNDALRLAHHVQRFGLTSVQAEILHMLAQGLDVEAIAAQRGVKVGTVRAHVHELLNKTGLTRQAELVRLALGR